MTSPATLPPPRPAPPLVGRTDELAALRDALAAALAGRGSLVLIGGAAGIGKTALAEATLALAADQGALTLVGRCYDLAETPPYGPWRELFDRAPRADGLPVLPTAVLPPERDGVSLSSQDAIAPRILSYLAALGASRPAVLLLEDLHWADPASLDLLRFLARGLAEIPLLLLATYRADEIAPDHPLATLLPALVREARADRLDLRPLDAIAIGALVAARYVLSTADHDRLIGYLTRRTEGNALFLGELLRTLESTAALHRIGDRWALGDLEGVPVPTLLRQVIAGRLARLGDEDRRLLAVAAVIGQEPPFALWAKVSEVEEIALLDTAERAITTRVLEATATGVRFAHALIREALYDGVLAPRRQAWHQRAGEALAATPAPDPDVAAEHFRRAGDMRAGEWLERAGERARRAYAWGMAAARLEAALVILEQRGADPGERGWLLLRLALLRRHLDRSGVLAIIAAARELAVVTADPLLEAHARFLEGLVHCYRQDFRAGVAKMEEAVIALDALPPREAATRARLRGWGLADDPDHHRGTISLWYANIGRLAEAHALGAAVASRGASPGANWLDGAFAPDALRGFGAASALQGRPAEAHAALESNAAAYHAAGDHAQVVTTLRQILLHVYLPYRADDLIGRRRVVAEIEAARTRAAGKNGPDYAPLATAPLYLVEGRWAEASTALAATAGLRLSDSGGTMKSRIAATLARWRGDGDTAWAIIREIFPLGPAIELGAVQFTEHALSLFPLAVALALDASDLTEAGEWLRGYDRLLAWSGTVLGHAEGQLGWAAYHRAAGDTIAARQHAEVARTHASEPRQPLALLAAHRALGELATAAGQHTEATTHLDTALALANACAAPYERALTLLALAELRAAMGDLTSAGAALVEARAILTPLDAHPALARADALAATLARPPEPSSAPAYPAGLSAREVGVLCLIAAGRANHEIAAQLSISPNTVLRHVSHILTKTGTTNRAAAAVFALRHGLATPDDARP